MPDTGEARIFVLPVGEATLLDNWDVMGLRATGSIDYRIDDVFVPEAFTHVATTERPRRGGQQYVRVRCWQQLPPYCWPDVALVDIRMPPTHTDEGLRAAGEIRSRYPATAVLVLSQHLELEYALRLVEEKPEKVGYLMKERVGRIEQLLDAADRVAAGECVVDRAVVEDLLARRRQGDPVADLTPREREILGLMAEGRSNQGIGKALWLSPKTVETHIRGAFQKLGIKEAPEDNRRVLAVLTYLRR